MARNNRKMCIISIGLIVIVVTLVVFFAGFSKVEKATLDYLALMFILISEIALFAGLTLLNNKSSMNKVMVNSGVISTLVIYWIVSIVLYLIYKNTQINNIGGFVTVQIILISLVAIITISLCRVASSVHASDNKIAEARVCLQKCENIIFTLKNDSKYETYKEPLNTLYEIIKYSDKTAMNNVIDEKINREILEISNDLKDSYSENDIDNKENHINEKIDHIISLIKERNMVLHESKRGGF